MHQMFNPTVSHVRTIHFIQDAFAMENAISLDCISSRVARRIEQIMDQVPLIMILRHFEHIYILLAIYIYVEFL